MSDPCCDPQYGAPDEYERAAAGLDFNYEPDKPRPVWWVMLLALVAAVVLLACLAKEEKAESGAPS